MPPDKRRVKKQSCSSADENEEIVAEYDVVVCNDIPRTELYRVQFPSRKKNTFNDQVHPRLRYKKNVKMMEMRLAADTLSGSFDKSKMEALHANAGSSNVKVENSILNSKSDEIYEGRAFSEVQPLQYALGFFKDKKFHIGPVSGTFNMQRSLAVLNAKPKGKEDDGNITEESDTEGSQPLRVKFARPETERQKKRREASALHREKLIASDHWIPMNVHLESSPAVSKKWDDLAPKAPMQSEQPQNPEVRDLVQRAIICGKMEQLDLTKTDQLMSHQRIRDLPPHLQIRAQVIKARVIRTEDLEKRIFPPISRSELISGLQKCAHLVRGVWVLQSEFLFQNLPPAHSTTIGRIDEQRAAVWREARDLSLALVDAGHRVTRATLSKCFLLNSIDAEQILSTFGVKGDKTWRLKVEPDDSYLHDPANLEIVLTECQYWVERFRELQNKVDRSASPKRVRRNSGKGSPQK